MGWAIVARMGLSGMIGGTGNGGMYGAVRYDRWDGQ